MGLPGRERVRHALRQHLGDLAPQGRFGVAALGHREYVGGMWEEIGRLQFDFLVEQGLRPEHVLLDIACGSLRGGVHFIDYLEAGHYLGIEKEQSLLGQGLKHELSPAARATKRPEFVISSRFEFERFSKRPDFSLAQSLFTHLTSTDLVFCLQQLRSVAGSGHRFYATFFPGETDATAMRSHAHATFRYGPEELTQFGAETGWQTHYIGEWGHPRGQLMMQFSVV